MNVRKRMYNAIYRAREDGYKLDSKKKIAYINQNDFNYWKNEKINASLKFLQYYFYWKIILL